MADGHDEAEAGSNLAPWDRMFAFVCSEQFAAHVPGAPVNWSLKWKEHESKTEFDVTRGGARKKSGEATGGVSFSAKLGKATRTTKYSSFAGFFKAVAKARTDEELATPHVISLDDVRFVWSNQETSRESPMSIASLGKALKSERAMQRNKEGMTLMAATYDDIAEAILVANETRLKNLNRSRAGKATGASASQASQEAPAEPAKTEKKKKKAPAKEPAAEAPQKTPKATENKKRKREEEPPAVPAASAPAGGRTKRAAAKVAASKVAEVVAEAKRAKTDKVDHRAMVVEFFDRIGDEMKAFAAMFDQLADVDMDDADAYVGDDSMHAGESDSDSDPDALLTGELTPDSDSGAEDGAEDSEEDGENPYNNALFCEDECNELKESADDDDEEDSRSNHKVVDDDENTVFAAPSKKAPSKSAASKKASAPKPTPKPAASKKPAQEKKPAAEKKPAEPKPKSSQKAEAPAKTAAPKAASQEKKQTPASQPKKQAAETQKPPVTPKSAAPKPTPAQKAPGKASAPPTYGGTGPLVMPSQMNGGGQSMSDVIAAADNSMMASSVVDF